MAYINIELANAWTDKDRLNLTTIDANLENQIASQVIQRASQAFDVTFWTDITNTPMLIKSIISMTYVGRSYQSKTLDNISGLDNYGTKLIEDARLLLDAVVKGEIQLFDEEGNPIPIYSTGVISGEPMESEPFFTVAMEF